MSDKFGERLRKIRQKSGLSQTEFGKRLGRVSLPTINRLENSSSKLPNAELIIALMREFDADPAWLLTGEEQAGVDCPKTPVLRSLPKDYDAVPDESIEGWVALPDLPENCFGFRVPDDAIAPLLKKGDFALFRPGPVEDGDVAVFSDEWENVKIRRLRTKDDQKVLVSDNPEYPLLSCDDKCRLIGKVLRGVREITT